MDKRPEIIDLIEDDDWIKKKVKPHITLPVTSQPNNVILVSLVNSNLTRQEPSTSFVSPQQSSSWINPSVPLSRQHYKTPGVLAASAATEVQPAKATSELGNKLFESFAKDEKVDVNVLTVEYKGVKYGVSGIVMPITMSRLVPIETIEVKEQDDGGVEDAEAVRGEVSSSQDSDDEDVKEKDVKTVSTHQPSPCSPTPSKLSPLPSDMKMSLSKTINNVDLMMDMADKYQPQTLADWEQIKQDFNQEYATDYNSMTLARFATQCRERIRQEKGWQPWDQEIYDHNKFGFQTNIGKQEKKRVYHEKLKKERLEEEIKRGMEKSNSEDKERTKFIKRD